MDKKHLEIDVPARGRPDSEPAMLNKHDLKVETI